MTIELTEAQRQALQADRARLVDVIDPATKKRYVLVAREQFESAWEIWCQRGRPHGTHLQDWLEAERELQASIAHQAKIAAVAKRVSPDILLSQKSFWRDLPELLKDERNKGQWVCYHREERVGIGSYEELIRECVRRGLSESEYDLEVIEPHAVPPWESEEIEAGGHEVAD
jgi:hypothetical protein